MRKGDPHHIYLHLESGAKVAVHSITDTPDAPQLVDLWGANRGSWTPVGELGACVRRVGERLAPGIERVIWKIKW